MTRFRERSRIVEWVCQEPRWVYDAAAGSLLFGKMWDVLRRQWAHSRLLSLARRQAVTLRCVLVGFLGVLVWASPPTLRMSWMILGAGMFVSLACVGRLEPIHKTWVRRLFLYALMTRVLVAVVLYAVTPRVWIEAPTGLFQDGGFLIGDGYVYAYNGFWLAEQWRAGKALTDDLLRAISLSGSSDPFNYWNGFMTYWLDYHPLTLFFLSSFAGAWAGVLAYWVARRTLRERSARIAGLLTAFWPSLFVWSTQNLKEPLTVALLLTALALFLVPLRRRGWMSWAGGFGVTWLLHRFNFFVGPLLMAALLLYGLLYCSVRIRWFGAVLLLGILLGSFSVLSGKVPGPLLQVSQKVDGIIFRRPVASLMLEPNKLSGLIESLRRPRMLDARTPFFKDVRLDTPLKVPFFKDVRLDTPSKVIAFLPVGLMGLLTLPAPWTARSPGELLGSFEMLLWYPLLFFAFRGASRAILGSPGQQVILTLTLVLCSAMALLEGNIGTLFRHRAFVWPLLFFLTALGLQREPSREAV